MSMIRVEVPASERRFAA